jgi:hypothetical protein
MLSAAPMPEINSESTPTINKLKQTNKMIVKKNEEQQYLEMIRHIMDNGLAKSDRTGAVRRRMIMMY